ncbi:MAG: hypothetical protein QOE55_601, partial [Acidobacteriaceae bacterium]|nr:hypothetical protein [Acidobacteriaceae bacterium]
MPPEGVSSQSFRKVPHASIFVLKAESISSTLQERITPMTAEGNSRKTTDMYSSHDKMSIELLASATDEVLVAAAKLGDCAAFAELWERHSNMAFRMAYRIIGNQDDAEDVVQEAWMKAYVHLKTFDGRAKFSTWLTRIAINSALITLRKRRAHPE